MNRGRVYGWIPDPTNPRHGRIRTKIVALKGLDKQDEGKGRLWGRFVRVRNAGWVKERDRQTGEVRAVPLGDASPNSDGDFLFRPGYGGPRVEKVELHPYQSCYVSAARFGEVNTYYHVHRIARYVHKLLKELGAPPLPPVIAVVNAHHAVADTGEEIRDGVLRGERWLPFQGGHYRLASRRYNMPEHDPISPNGEIHLGPGWQLLGNGALALRAGRGYRANASHNAGIIYHEYGHHITRHTADFRANALRPPGDGDNRKSPLDEGTCDYWAATMLGTPHIWAWHLAHTDTDPHPRSLTSKKSMADYDHTRGADPHLNGTIWASALWDLRTAWSERDPDGARHTDLLLLQALLVIGKLIGDKHPPTPKSIREARASYSVGLAALLHADETLFGRRHADLILEVFGRRGIMPEANLQGKIPILPARPGTTEANPVRASLSLTRAALLESSPVMRGLLEHVPMEEIPETEELYSGEELERHLQSLNDPPLSIVAVGDVMLGGPSRKFIKAFGETYPFEAVRPLLRRAPIGLANLEGPLAAKAERQERHYSYRVKPRLTRAMLNAGINVVTLANNHLLDCGREGVLETLQALAEAGVAAIGAGVNRASAHAPAILKAGNLRVGLLGYYWNQRTSARGPWPGSATDPPEALAADLEALKPKVDRIVVTFHWGVPYVRDPSEANRAKARFAVDCGADMVIGHHPHVIQPFEIYRGHPIFYSVGNFTFGSGNSRGESLVLGVRFEQNKTVVQVYPVYVKNRDPRINYQPKLLRGGGAARLLQKLVQLSHDRSAGLRIEHDRGLLELPRPNGA
jgi:poly-gamma-glutamate capsule biosynthesis protein CapA/YwtB (metallophosphatase superfamily)